MTRPVTFRHADVAGAIKAVKAGGESVASVEFRPDGTFRVLTGAEVADEPPASELERWRRKRGRSVA